MLRSISHQPTRMTRYRTARLVALGCAAGLVIFAAQAAPFRPTDDSMVLERLPSRPADPVQRELRELRATHEARPRDVEPAVALARRYFNLALETGDLRYVGYAEAALSAWRRAEPAPVDVLVVRAQLAQYRHEFNQALKLFDAAIAQDPNNVRAHAWRAAVNMVVARYDAVRPDCDRLRELGEALLATGCAAYLDATLGKARSAYDTLAARLKAEPDARSTLKLWTLTVLAEIARRLGDVTAAEAHYQAALRLDDSDQYLLAAYAELLVHQRRWQDVVDLLRRWERSDVLLLLLARAEHALGKPEAKARASSLEARFADAALRGDSMNAQDEAWFRLEVQGDARKALSLALQNWSVQKEPRDAEIVLEAALAARDPAAAAPVLEWMAGTGLQDPRLAALAQALRRSRR
jgi:tetratricopeptide (TPR) repeat protein